LLCLKTIAIFVIQADIMIVSKSIDEEIALYLRQISDEQKQMVLVVLKTMSAQNNNGILSYLTDEEETRPGLKRVPYLKKV